MPHTKSFFDHIEEALIALILGLMTALTFILGVLPLATASGAGAAAQQAIGIGVIGGMIASTVIGILMVPALYAGIMRVIEWSKQKVNQP